MAEHKKNVSHQNQENEQQGKEAEPQIFAIQKDDNGKWKFSRRNFLASIGATAAATAVGVSAGKVYSSGSEQAGTQTFRAHLGDVVALAATSDGALLASISTDETVKLWTLETPRGLYKSASHDAPVTALVVSSDSKVFATADSDGKIKIWSLPDGDLEETLDSRAEVHALAINPAGDILASADSAGQVRLWSLPAGDAIANLGSHDAAAFDLVFSADGQYLISAGGNTLKIWSVSDEEELTTLEGYVSEALWYVSASDWINIRSGGGTNHSVLGSLAPGSIVRVVNTVDDWHEIIRDDGSTAFVSATLTEPLPALSSRIALSQDGALLATAGDGGVVSVWSVPDGELLTTLTGHPQGISTLTMSHDGSLLAVANGDGVIKLWSLPDGELVNEFSGHERWVNSLIFDADDSHLVSGSNDDTIKIWTTRTGTANTLTGHTGNVNVVLISPDGNLLISGSADDTIRIWDYPGGNYAGGYMDTAANPAEVEGRTLRGNVDSIGSSVRVELTLPCGSPIPAGFTCVCDCVASDLPPTCSCVGHVAPTAVPAPVATVCTCDTVCNCEGVCSCDGHCSCNAQGGHYWFPN